MSPVEYISLKLLTLKNVAILALLSAQIVDSLHKLKLGDILTSDHAVKIKFTDILKQSRPKFFTCFLSQLKHMHGIGGFV